MPEPVKILVIGGTGVVGSQVVRALLERGANLRILVRDASAKVPAGVETAIGDLLDPPTVERAMDGVQKLYLLNGVVADELTQALIAYDLAKRRGLEHVLYHSVFRAEQFPDVPHFASKVAVERALRAFDVPWTIVRPNYFMQNDATMREPITKAGLYPSPLGPTGISMVDVRDIADASAIALTTGGHAGKTYNLNGPSIVDGPGAAALWSEALGTPVRYGGHDVDAFEAALRERAPSWSAFDLRMMFQGYLERGFTAEPGDLEALTKLLGRPPRTYDAYVRETAAAWKTESA